MGGAVEVVAIAVRKTELERALLLVSVSGLYYYQFVV